MKGINRVLKRQQLNRTARIILESISDDDVPCIFVSYQREDEEYAREVADYIMSKQLDVYFDLEDSDLKKGNQRNNPQGVTDSIKKGLNQSEYMIVIVSPNTYRSLWVPFEVGYAFDKKEDKMKILRHKGINKAAMPAYMKVKELLNGTTSLNRFLDSIRKTYLVYESLIEKGERVEAFSEYNANPLNKYLDKE